MNKQKKMRNIPSKTGINLAMHEDHSASIRLVVLGCVVIALLAGAVAKFGVIDQFARRDEAAAAYNQIHSQLLQMEGALADYDKVETDYRTHAMDWLGSDPDSAYAQVHRQKVLDLVESQLMPRGSIHSITVFNDVMHIDMSGMDLAGISEMLASLEAQPIVGAVRLNLAQTDKEQTLLTFSLTVTLQPEEVAE